METHVRTATDSDLDAVLAWLQAEDARGVEGCFWCNHQVVRSSHRKGNLTVLSVLADGSPIGFCARADCEIDLLALREEFRGRGYGSRFARHVFEAAESEGLPGLQCECRPSDSIRFWEGLGFTRIDPEEEHYRVARPFRRTRGLISGLPTRAVRIEILHAYEDKPHCEPFETPASDNGGSLILETEFSACVPWYDARIRVAVDGKEVHLKKVKHSKKSSVECELGWVTVKEFCPTDR